jgi:hypothetical protein
MTCIAALKHKGKVYMAADSAGVAGYNLTVLRSPKIYRVGDFLFGFTSSFRMGQLLGHKLKVPKQTGGDVEQFMCTVFVDAIRECFRTGGFMTKSSEAEAGGEFLVGYRGRIFKVCSDFLVAEARLPFDACGCGQDVALGSLFSSEGDPKERLRLALKAAERFSGGVRGPFLVKDI